MASCPAPLVHVYPQNEAHDAVYIVGTVEGLRRLRGVLDAAILRGSIASDVFRPSDGLDYACVVACATDVQMQDVPLGYTDLADDRVLPEWVRAGAGENEPPLAAHRSTPAQSRRVERAVLLPQAGKIPAEQDPSRTVADRRNARPRSPAAGKFPQA